jgi:MATE family multidrug resistance protein
VNTSLLTLAFVLFNFLNTATTPMLATAVGQGNATAAGEVVYQATGLALLLGVGVAAGLSANADWLLDAMGADASQGVHMHELAVQYLLLR